MGTVTAFGFACGAFGLGYVTPPEQAFVAPQRMATVQQANVSTRDLPHDWPAVFGTVPIVAEPEPEPEPEPEVAEQPPEENTTYYLTGLVAGGAGESWAMISENDRGLVVRIGDVLIGGETVTAIDAAGVWIDYQGETQLIPVKKADFGTMVTVKTQAEPTEPASVLAEVRIPLERFDRTFINRALTSAGRLAATERLNTDGMDLVWMQRGELFDQMGLRTGDTIVSVNGKALQTDDLIADMPDSDLLGGSLQLEILRDGTRQMLKITLDQG